MLQRDLGDTNHRAEDAFIQRSTPMVMRKFDQAGRKNNCAEDCGNFHAP